MASKYINNQLKKISNILKDFDIVGKRVVYGNSGYGYLPNEVTIHSLKDGSYFREGFCFDSAKAKDVPFCNYYGEDNKLIKRYLE